MSQQDGTIGCTRCGTYDEHTDLCGGGCGLVLHMGMDAACKGNPAYHATDAHGMGGRFAERYDEHVAPPPGERFKPAPGVSLPDYVPGKGYRITSLADRRKLMKLNHVDYRSHPGRTEF